MGKGRKGGRQQVFFIMLDRDGKRDGVWAGMGLFTLISKCCSGDPPGRVKRQEGKKRVTRKKT